MILGEPYTVNLGRPAEAAVALQEAVAMTTEAANKDPHDSASRIRLGESTLNLAELLRERDPRRALAVYDLGIRRLGETPDSLIAHRMRAKLLTQSSYALRQLQRPAESRRRLDAAMALLQETKDYPAGQRIRLDSPVHLLLSALADEKAARGDFQHALRMYQDLLCGVLAWPAEPETNLPDAAGLSRLYTAITRLNRAIGRNGTASALEKRRREIWKHWDARLPNNPFIRRQLNG